MEERTGQPSRDAEESLARVLDKEIGVGMRQTTSLDKVFADTVTYSYTLASHFMSLFLIPTPGARLATISRRRETNGTRPDTQT